MKKQVLSLITVIFFIGCFQQGKAQTGASLNFDGVDDYVSVGNVNVLPVSYTKEAWIYMNGDDGSNNIISGGDADGEHAFWAPGLILSAGHNGAWTTVADNTTLNLNQWYHVAVTYDSPTQTMSLYKNGVLVSQATGVIDYTGGNVVRVGAYNDAQNLFIGNIDEVRIWNFALSASQINSTMNCVLSGAQTGLVLYYNFDQGIANGNNSGIITATDITSNANNGTLNNFALTGTGSNFVDNATLSIQVTTTITTTSNTVCAGTPVTLTAATPTGGASPYMYTWHPGGTAGSSATLTNTTTITPSATSTVTAVKKWWALVTDANGCAFTNDTVSVQVNSLPQMTTVAKSLTVCAGVPDTLIGVPIGGGLAPLTYTWHPGGTTANNDTTVITPSFTTATGVKKWFMAVQDANGCVFTNDTVSVQVNALPTVSFSGDSSICSGTTTTLTAHGATSYTWSSGSGSATTNTISVHLNASLTFTLTGTNGTCSNKTVGTITVSPTPTVTISNLGSNIICIGSLVSLTANGASSYIWSANAGSATTSTVTMMPSTTDSYTVTGTTGLCTSHKVVTIVVNPLPTVAVNSATICAGNAATLTASGTAISYTWNTGENTASITPSPTLATDYTVTATNGSNCINTATVSVSVNTPPTVAVNSSTICAGNTTTLTASGTATSYSWSTGDATASITETPTLSASYTVTGTDANNCMNTAVAMIAVNSLPSISVNSASVCVGATTATLTASGTSTSYSWSTGDATASITETPTLSASYTVTGTDANNCVDSVVAMITVNPLPTISVSNATICAGNTTTLTASGTATSYSWSTGDVTASITETPTLSASYTVTGTDANNCVNTATVSVSVNTPPTVAVNSSTICAGNTTTLTASGTATSYSWSTGDATASITETPTLSASYTVTGTDANNCMNTAVAMIAVNSLPSISVNSASVCVGATTATLTASGTSTSYSWSTGDATASITETPTLSASYTVTGTDANNCVDSVVAMITVNPLPTISVSNATICAGNTTTLTASGTATSYSWSTGDVTASITETPTLSASYTVTGTDANNCVNTATVSVSVNTPPTVAVNSSTICAGNTTTLTASGTATSYSWSTGDATASITETPTLSASYTVTGTDANNCMNTAVAMIAVNSLPSNSVTVAGDVLMAVNPSASYQWIDCGTHTAISGATNQTYTATITGNYEVMLTETGCVDTSACNMVTVTGINTYANNQGISIYPNPASDALFIQTNISFENATIEVYDMIGQKVLAEKVQNNLTKISLGSLINAVYQIRVINNSTLIYQNRIVKQQ